MIAFYISLIVFLALPLGIILAYIAKEELHDGKKYFQLGQYILLITAGILTVFSLPFWTNMLVAGVFLFFFLIKEAYLAFPLMLSAAEEQKEFLLIFAGVWILFLFFEGTCFYEKNKNKKIRLLSQQAMKQYGLLFFFCFIPLLRRIFFS